MRVLSLCLLAAMAAPAMAADKDCIASKWSEWSDCDPNDDYIKTRTRTILAPKQGEGAECPETEQERKCIIDCKMNQWSPWTSCNYEVGPQTRSRSISSDPQNGGDACGETVEKKDCLDVNCDYKYDSRSDEVYAVQECNGKPTLLTVQRYADMTNPWSGKGLKCERMAKPQKEVTCPPQDCRLQTDVTAKCHGDGGPRNEPEHVERQSPTQRRVAAGAACDFDITTCSKDLHRCKYGDTIPITDANSATAAGLSAYSSGALKTYKACPKEEPTMTDWEYEGSPTCDGTVKEVMKTRKILTEGFGAVQPYQTIQTVIVNRCKVQDCVVGRWSSWTSCADSLVQTRSRAVKAQPDPIGDQCPNLTEQKSCDISNLQTQSDGKYDCEKTNTCGELVHEPFAADKDYT